MASDIATIDQYITLFPDDVREKLRQIRRLIHEQAPTAREYLFYKIPSMSLLENQKARDGLMFAAFKQHIGLYPGPEIVKYFREDINDLGLKYTKGTIQFPLAKPLPLAFISRIIAYKLSHG
jgi:uncharacterized protein YdhG (YjbR/CyaY superfamily)